MAEQVGVVGPIGGDHVLEEQVHDAVGLVDVAKRRRLLLMQRAEPIL